MSMGEPDADQLADPRAAAAGKRAPILNDEF